MKFLLVILLFLAGCSMSLKEVETSFNKKVFDRKDLGVEVTATFQPKED